MPPHEPRPDQTRIQDLLEKQGIQATAQRMLIAELLFARDQHLTAEQIIQTLAERGTDVSKATVYNTLNLFAAKGLVKPLQVDPERGLFDSNMRPHYHFHVEDTGELIDVPPGDSSSRACRRCHPAPSRSRWTSSSGSASRAPDALPGTRALPILRAPLPV